VAYGPGLLSSKISKRNPNCKIKGCDLSSEIIRLAKVQVQGGEFVVSDSISFLQNSKKADLTVAGFMPPCIRDQRNGNSFESLEGPVIDILLAIYAYL
jgi:ubiquinone/menaquinone biosynthesis C-methylase UbiE